VVVPEAADGPAHRCRHVGPSSVSEYAAHLQPKSVEYRACARDDDISTHPWKIKYFHRA
jgi:hypothetical protein